MGLGPVPATEKVLARAGWSVDDLDAAELNEAFATQSIASMRRLGIKPEIVNAWGGAIALGHPLGSSGSRIVITLLSRLEAEEKSRGLATMCVGVGQHVCWCWPRRRNAYRPCLTYFSQLEEHHGKLSSIHRWRARRRAHGRRRCPRLPDLRGSGRRR